MSNTSFLDPGNNIPFVEKDNAIIRSLTKGMYDFSNPDCYSGAGAIPINTKFNGLTVDEAQGYLT